MKYSRLQNLTVALILAGSPVICAAHHSRALYSSEIQEWDGEIVDIEWKNPHVMFSLKSVDETGREVVRRLEAVSIYMLNRGGATRDVFTIGAQVRVAAQQSTLREDDFVAANMLLPDGVEVLLTGRQPRWPNVRILGSREWALNEERLKDVAEDGKGIFRVWSVPPGAGGGGQNVSFTPAALEGRKLWDHADNYITRCEPHGMPRIMNQPHPFEFIDNGMNITLLSEEYDLVRTIHLEDAEDPANQEANLVGYSTGQWEDNTLVVKTSRINWPYFDNIGTPQSEDVTIEERFTLRADEGRLDYIMTVTDPSILSEPATYEKHWLAQGEELMEYNCQPGESYAAK